MTFNPFSKGKRSGRSTASKRADAGEDTVVRRAADARMEETTDRRSSSEGDEDMDKEEEEEEVALVWVVNRVGAKPSAMTARRERKQRLETFIIVVFVEHERSE